MRSHPHCPKLPRSGIALLAVVGLTLGTGAFRPAASAPALTPPGRTGLGAQWLVASLSDAGLLPSPTDPSQPSPTTTAQAVSALVAAGGRSAAVDLMLDALAPLVDDIATEGGTDSAGGLGALIGAVVAGGRDARAFGTPPQDLVARLRAMQRPDGLFGLADPTYDGAYRQGLALLGLAAVGETDADGLDWLEEQQCPTGLWVSYRPDPTAPCPPADADTYTGPDSNSSALAVMALVAHGRSDSAQTGAAALEAVRAADGGWSFIPGTALATDSVSTALVALALRMARGAPDGEGLIALDAFQVGCEGPEADRGGVGYQPGVDGSLVPDAGATTAAVLAYSGTALPVDGAVGPLPTAPCSQPVPAPTSSPTTDAPTTTTAPTLPRTGTSGLPVALGLLGLGLGSVLVFLGRRR